MCIVSVKVKIAGFNDVHFFLLLFTKIVVFFVFFCLNQDNLPLLTLCMSVHLSVCLFPTVLVWLLIWLFLHLPDLFYSPKRNLGQYRLLLQWREHNLKNTVICHNEIVEVGSNIFYGFEFPISFVLFFVIFKHSLVAQI